VARPLFEQYKDALRRGHVALLGEEFETAIAAYQEAAALVPDRPLPHASLAGVLERLGQVDAARAAYDRAIALAPEDPALAAARDRVALAAPPAAEQPSWTVSAQARPWAGEPQPEPRAEPVPAPPPAPPPAPEPRRRAAPESGVDEDAAALDAIRAAFDRRDDPDAASAGDEAPPAAETPAADAVVVPDEPPPMPVMTSLGDAGQGVWPAIDLPSLPPPPLEGPLPDAWLLQAEAEAMLDAGDTAGARDRLLTAAIVHREGGRLDAALDACLQLLAIAPGDPQVHLAIANLQLDRDWREVATEKIELLLRLTSLSGDSQAEADVHLLAADRLRDESPARLDARRRGLPTP
jgi:tetratricopeptide (TPR) repeat protein